MQQECQKKGWRNINESIEARTCHIFGAKRGPRLVTLANAPADNSPAAAIPLAGGT
jgi:hypothetical protein